MNDAGRLRSEHPGDHLFRVRDIHREVLDSSARLLMAVRCCENLSARWKSRWQSANQPTAHKAVCSGHEHPAGARLLRYAHPYVGIVSAKLRDAVNLRLPSP